MTERKRDNETENPYLNEAALILARVQGHWDKESEKLLQDNSSFKDVGFLRVFLSNMVGDESMAYVILGKSIVLPERDRGILVLSETISEDLPGFYKEWQISAILSQAASEGMSLEKILEGLNERSSGFLGSLMKIVGTGDDKDEFEGNTASITNDLRNASRKDKKELEAKVLTHLCLRIGAMNEKELISISNRVKIRAGDEMVATGLSSAKQLLTEILEKKLETFHSVLNYLNGHE